MKRRWRIRVLSPALGLLGLCASRAQAVTPRAALNIDVTISASVAVQVDNAATSTYTAAGWSPANRFLVSASTATVTNASSGLSEQWWLATNAASINTAGNALTWSLATSTITTTIGGDSFAVQAVFVTSAAVQCPVYNDWRWSTSNAPPLTSVPAQYTQNQFLFNEYDGTMGGRSNPDNLPKSLMSAFISATGAGRRALCWRVVGPTSTSTPDLQNIQIIVTAVQGS